MINQGIGVPLNYDNMRGSLDAKVKEGRSPVPSIDSLIKEIHALDEVVEGFLLKVAPAVSGGVDMPPAQPAPNSPQPVRSHVTDMAALATILVTGIKNRIVQVSERVEF